MKLVTEVDGNLIVSAYLTHQTSKALIEDKRAKDRGRKGAPDESNSTRNPRGPSTKIEVKIEKKEEKETESEKPSTADESINLSPPKPEPLVACPSNPLANISLLAKQVNYPEPVIKQFIKEYVDHFHLSDPNERRTNGRWAGAVALKVKKAAKGAELDEIQKRLSTPVKAQRSRVEQMEIDMQREAHDEHMRRKLRNETGRTEK